MENQTVGQVEEQKTNHNLTEDENLKGDEMDEEIEVSQESIATVTTNADQEKAEDREAKVKQMRGRPKGSKATPRESSPLEKKVLLEIVPPDASEALAMDGTTHQEISVMRNVKYSQEIFDDVAKVYDPATLKELAGKDRDKFRVEAGKQLHRLWQGCESLTAHTNVFTVRFLIAAGEILEMVDNSFKRRSDFNKWFNENLGVHKRRYFQQARQLYEMGPIAYQYASLGKNRLLNLDRLKNLAQAETVEELIQRHPFPDTTTDGEGVIFKEHVDAIITFYRLKDAGLDFVDFESAKLAAAINHDALPVNIVKTLSNLLQGKEEREKKDIFEHFLQDKLGRLPKADTHTSDASQPDNGGGEKRNPNSLNKLLVDISDCCEGLNFDTPENVTELKAELNPDFIRRAHARLVDIAVKLSIDLNTNLQSQSL